MHAKRETPARSELARLSYTEVDERLGTLESRVLLELLDSKSIKIGDTAADHLARRRETHRVVTAIVGDQLRTKGGKIRALHTLRVFGAGCSDAGRAYRHAAADRNDDVVDSALFGLVFLQDVESLPLIGDLLSIPNLSKGKKDSLLRARKALKKRDPFIYSPYYSDPHNIWKLKSCKSKKGQMVIGVR